MSPTEQNATYGGLDVLPRNFNTVDITNYVRFTGEETLKLLPPLSDLPEQDLSSSPQDAVKPFTIIEGPLAWKGPELWKNENQFIYHMTEKDVAELDAAIAKVEKSGVRSGEEMVRVGRQEFPLPTFGPKLRELVKAEVRTRGFHVIRGVPVKKYSGWQLTLIWWGIGVHLGRVQPLNKYGHLIGHVRCLEAVGAGRKTRSPNTNQVQAMHSDQFASDLGGLFQIRQAKTGGEFTLTSSITIHNELLKRGRKDLVEALLEQNFWLNKTGYENYKSGLFHAETGEQEFFPSAVFQYLNGRLVANCYSNAYLANMEVPGIPKLTPLQLEALRTFMALAMDPRLSLHYLQQPGDIQLFHNISVLHGREYFEDGETEDEKRWLMRWWLDATGKPEDELRNTPPIAVFGQRMGSMLGGWPYAKKPYSVVFDTALEADPAKVQYL